MKMKIVLTGGGSGGHILPNLALAPKLRKNFDIYYIGGDAGMERELAARHGLPFFSVPCVKLARSASPKNLAIPFVLKAGIKAAKKLLADIEPDVVFSKGGYVALPVAMAARKLGIPYIIHESDMSMGLSNRLVAKGAAYACGSFADSVSGLPNGAHTGAPIRGSLYSGDAMRARRSLGITSSKPVLLVMGGSTGALTLNNCLWNSLDKLTSKYEVIHLTGKGKGTMQNAKCKMQNEGQIKNLVNPNNNPDNNSSFLIPNPSFTNYHPIEFTDNIQDLYAAASLCVTRGGAGALFELIALKIPALVIPLPKSRSSRGDQVQNARRMAELGYCSVLPQEELTPDTLMLSLDALAARAPAFKTAMRSARNVDGSERIIQLITDCALQRAASRP